MRNCNHEFHNITFRHSCPRCGHLLKKTEEPTAKKQEDEGFDAAGFALGMATGAPLSPTHGVSTGALLGAALHSDPTPAATPDPAPATPDPAPFSGGGGNFGGGGSDGGGSSPDGGGGGGGGGGTD